MKVNAMKCNVGKSSLPNMQANVKMHMVFPLHYITFHYVWHYGVYLATAVSTGAMPDKYESEPDVA